MGQISVFGPVPSRRLGRSLGINNIPPKTCSYSCVYCQIGRTSDLRVRRGTFYRPEEVVERVRERVAEVQDSGERIDYLTFVPDGEPTLDINLGREIEALYGLGIPIAVITNASLIHDEGVRGDLQAARLVSLKVDSVDQGVWRRVNRPHRSLSIEAIVDGMKAFSSDFKGTLMTETMLLHGFDQRIEETASFISTLGTDRSYISVPTRPPAERWVQRPDEATVLSAYQQFMEHGVEVELLLGFEGGDFFTKDLADDILAITSVHPMREDALAQVLKRTGMGWEAVQSLVSRGRLVELEHEGHRFYLRSFKG